METVARMLQETGESVELHRAEQTSPEILQQNTRFIFATSTWEHGELNPFFRSLHTEMQKMDFHGKTAAMIGLGDNRYEPVLFNMGIEKIRDTWTKNGGVQLFHTLKINGSPYHLLDTVVAQWAADVKKEWQENHAIENLLLGKT